MTIKLLIALLSHLYAVGVWKCKFVSVLVGLEVILSHGLSHSHSIQTLCVPFGRVAKMQEGAINQQCKTHGVSTRRLLKTSECNILDKVSNCH